MKKLIILTLLSSIVLFTTSAFAATVGSTSKKGSVLKWPLIDIQQEDKTDTIIHISNDNTYRVQVKCYYMNEVKGRLDFSFYLTN